MIDITYKPITDEGDGYQIFGSIEIDLGAILATPAPDITAPLTALAAALGCSGAETLDRCAAIVLKLKGYIEI